MGVATCFGYCFVYQIEKKYLNARYGQQLRKGARNKKVI